MKKIIMTITILLVFLPRADACVGKILYIGTLNSATEQVLGEILCVLINERTGTTVNIKSYSSTKELYNALRNREINILLENTERSFEILERQKEENAKTSYDISKEEFRKKLNLVWLEPFSPLTGNGGKSHHSYVPAITVDVLTNFPALPRVINKLGGVISDDVFAKLMQSVRAGEKPKKAARDFLKTKKLI